MMGTAASSANITADQKQNAQSQSATQFSCTQHAVAALSVSFLAPPDDLVILLAVNMLIFAFATYTYTDFK